MKTIGNIIWVLFGGLELALGYFCSGVALCITIIGIPFGVQIFKLGALALWPFGKDVKTKPGEPGCLSVVMNVLWILLGWWEIALVHLFFGILCCITIIGIPFGKQHFKLMLLGATPYGVTYE